DRIQQEDDAAKTIATLCGGLPLALRIAGAVLKGKQHWTVSRFANRLRDERGRLDVLHAGDLDVRSSFDVSYRTVDAESARLFRLLGLLPGPDFPGELAAAVVDSDLESTGDTLELLHESHLLEAL